MVLSLDRRPLTQAEGKTAKRPLDIGFERLMLGGLQCLAGRHFKKL